MNSSNHVNFYETPLSNLDLDLNNYSMNDLLNLFNLQSTVLNDEMMKSAKKITLKMHPDKSRLDPKFYIFFTDAYNRLEYIYDFQNKSAKKTNSNTNYETISGNNEKSNKIALDTLKKDKLKNGENFNDWFNQSFEKYRTDDPLNRGYGDWLKSNDGFININENVSMTNMNGIFEQKKKQVQSLTVYNGVQDGVASFGNASFSMLDDADNFTTEKYTDLKQAYTETVIPVTMEDFDRMPKYNNLDEYMQNRQRVDVTPINRNEAMAILERQEKETNVKSQALAYKYAREAEKVKENQGLFWGALKQLTG
jgi:hypothetical protein